MWHRWNSNPRATIPSKAHGLPEIERLALRGKFVVTREHEPSCRECEECRKTSGKRDAYRGLLSRGVSRLGSPWPGPCLVVRTGACSRVGACSGRREPRTCRPTLPVARRGRQSKGTRRSPSATSRSWRRARPSGPSTFRRSERPSMACVHTGQIAHVAELRKALDEAYQAMSRNLLCELRGRRRVLPTAWERPLGNGLLEVSLLVHEHPPRPRAYTDEGHSEEQ